MPRRSPEDPRPDTPTPSQIRDTGAGPGVRVLSARWRTPAQIVNQSPNPCSRGKSASSRTLTRRRAGSVSVGTC